MAKPGDKVRVKTNNREFVGILMPNQETDSTIVKLESGYNVGVDNSNIKKIVVIEEFVEKDIGKGQKQFGFDKKKKTITILHTGGTIASKVDYKTGGVVARFSPEEIIQNFPEIKDIANIDSWLISNMFSEDMRFSHYSLICEQVKKAIDKGTDGIIITHGTDTLAYTSAALAFMLEDLPVPVLLVGAQRSSDRGSSDAAVNLICAALFINQTDFCDIGICMHEGIDDKSCLILPATKTRKMHSSRRDAFKSVNDKPIASVDYKSKKITFIKKNYQKKGKRSLTVKNKMEEKVAILRVHPNMIPEQFDFYRKEDYKGLIIEGTGLGQAPVGTPNDLCNLHKKNFDAIKDLIKSGCVVVMCSQTIYGAVQMHVYSNAIELVNIGVIPGSDMLTETAFVKLSWLLANYPIDKVKELMEENLKGEINKRIMPDEDFQSFG